MARKDISDFQVLQTVKEWWDSDMQPPRPIERLSAKTGQHPNVCLRAIQRAVSRDLLEYGVSEALPWLTPKGKELLEKGEEGE